MAAFPLWHHKNRSQFQLICDHPKYQDLLNRKRTKLMRNTDLDTILPYLRQYSVIDVDFQEQLIRLNTTSNRINMLIDHIEKGPCWHLHALCRALVQTDQQHIVSNILRLDVTKYDCPESDDNDEDLEEHSCKSTKYVEIVARCKVLTMDDLAGYIRFGAKLTEDDILLLDDEKVEELDKKLMKWLIQKYGEAESERKELNILLLGKTGSGKSSTGNLLLGSKGFIESSGDNSCTKTIKMGSYVMDGVKINVIDTPGFKDTHLSEKDTLTEIAKVMECFSDGIDGFFYVLNKASHRFTQEDRECFNLMRNELFGNRCIDFCYVILTHVTGEMVLLEYLKDNKDSELNRNLQQICPRIMAVDNKEPSEYMRSEMRTQIIRMVQNGTAGRYTNEDFKRYKDSKMHIYEDRSEAAKHYADAISELVFRQLSGRPRIVLQSMDDLEKEKIVKDVATKLCKNVTDPALKEEIHSATAKAVTVMTKRFIDPEASQTANLLANLFTSLSTKGAAIGGTAGAVSGGTVGAMAGGPVGAVVGAGVGAVGGAIIGAFIGPKD